MNTWELKVTGNNDRILHPDHIKEIEGADLSVYRIMCKVGVIVPSFCDQDYLRDRDIWVLAADDDDAVQGFIDHYKTYWLRRDEYKYVQVIERVEVTVTMHERRDN